MKEKISKVGKHNEEIGKKYETGLTSDQVNRSRDQQKGLATQTGLKVRGTLKSGDISRYAHRFSNEEQ